MKAPTIRDAAATGGLHVHGDARDDVTHPCVSRPDFTAQQRDLNNDDDNDDALDSDQTLVRVTSIGIAVVTTTTRHD